MSTESNTNTDANDSNDLHVAVELIKKKNPFKYKAMSIASVGYFDDESVVPNFMEELESLIRSMSNFAIHNPETSALKFPIPAECKDLDNNISRLVTDIQGGIVTSEIAGFRIKGLFETGLNLLKDYTKLYSPGGSGEILERTLGVFDLIMSLEEVAKISDDLKTK